MTPRHTPFFCIADVSAKEWEDLVELAAAEQQDGFRAYLQLVRHADLVGASANAVISRIPESTQFSVLVFADDVSFGSLERSLLCVDSKSPDQQLRCIPSELWGIENNLSIANMDFEEFQNAAGPDGVFRGF